MALAAPVYLRAALSSGDPSEPLAALGRAGLCADERARLERIRHAPTAAGFLVGRALLRGALDRHVGAGPWRLVEGPRGKPAIEGRPDVGVNISHTQGCVVVALTLGGEVGVDVEAPGRDTDTDKIAHRYFAATELEALRALPDAASRRARFFALWTLKESYMKATGQGFAMPLGSFAFTFDEAGAQRGFRADPERDPAWQTWRFARGEVRAEEVSFPVALCARWGDAGPASELDVRWEAPPYSQARTSLASAKISWIRSP